MGKIVPNYQKKKNKNGFNYGNSQQIVLGLQIDEFYQRNEPKRFGEAVTV